MHCSQDNNPSMFVGTGNDDDPQPLDFDDDERGGRGDRGGRDGRPKDNRSIGQKILDRRNSRPNRKKWLTDNVQRGL